MRVTVHYDITGLTSELILEKSKGELYSPNEVLNLTKKKKIIGKYLIRLSRMHFTTLRGETNESA